MTVCKLAFNNFREFTKNATADAVRSEKAQARRCCHFMLDRYFAENQKDFIKKQDCCEKHSIPKRYDADGEISKSSSSQSMSSSSSSSSSLLSQDIINSSSLKPTKNPFFKRTLADDEESMFAAHCPRLYNCFYPKSAEEDMIVKRLLEK